jgi:hypothetical protein
MGMLGRWEGESAAKKIFEERGNFCCIYGQMTI